MVEVISGYLNEESVIASLRSDNKEAVVREITGKLYSLGRIDNKDEVERAILHRESLGSTGIGDHVAIPHARLKALSEPVLMFARSDKGIEFSSLDGKKVNFFFFLLFPFGNAGLQLKILARISRLVRQAQFCDNLLVQENSSDILRQLTTAEQAL